MWPTAPQGVKKIKKPHHRDTETQRKRQNVETKRQKKPRVPPSDFCLLLSAAFVFSVPL
jgi:hypothetical protein